MDDKKKNDPRRNFKRADTETLREMLNQRKAEGGWNKATLAEIEAELEYRESELSSS